MEQDKKLPKIGYFLDRGSLLYRGGNVTQVMFERLEEDAATAFIGDFQRLLSSAREALAEFNGEEVPQAAGDALLRLHEALEPFEDG